MGEVPCKCGALITAGRLYVTTADIQLQRYESPSRMAIFRGAINVATNNVNVVMPRLAYRELECANCGDFIGIRLVGMRSQPGHDSPLTRVNLVALFIEEDD